jgi:DNA-binding NarL/FixJ family response regulator
MQNMTDPIRILIVDDHQIVRKGLVQLFTDSADMQVVGEAASGVEALALSPKLRPDIVFMDLKMNGLSGIETTRALDISGTVGAIIGLSTFSDAANIQAMREAGARGYVPKDALADEILAAARRVHGGETVFPDLPEVETAGLHPSGLSTAAQLGVQQKRVLALMTKGLTNPEIAQQLDVSRTTISYHVSAILRKLEVSNRSEAVAVALQEGVIGNGDF